MELVGGGGRSVIRKRGQEKNPDKSSELWKERKLRQVRIAGRAATTTAGRIGGTNQRPET